MSHLLLQIVKRQQLQNLQKSHKCWLFYQIEHILIAEKVGNKRSHYTKTIIHKQIEYLKLFQLAILDADKIELSTEDITAAAIAPNPIVAIQGFVR